MRSSGFNRIITIAASAMLCSGIAAVLAPETGSTEDVTTLDARSPVFKDGFPHQYERWKATEIMDFKSAYNGNMMEDVLEKDPRLVVLWAGYGFSKDYNAPRGHMYTITDVRNTLRTGGPKNADDGPMPMACWSCKSTDVPRLIEANGKDDYFSGKWAGKGHEIVNPIGCIDCHDSSKAEMPLRISRPWLKTGLTTLNYDLEKATSKDMQSLVCAQCHVEYYFAGDNKEVVLPWAKGTLAENAETYYDDLQFKDWTHSISKTPMLKAQHPGWEMWREGVHGKNDVSCVDCHMPQRREKGVTFTDHRIMSPLDNIEGTCQSCHSQSRDYLMARVVEHQVKIQEIKIRAEDLLVKAHIEAGEAWKAGAKISEMEKALNYIRHAQWRWDFAIASHGASFHAPTESLRVLGAAVDHAGQARVELAKVLTRLDVPQPVKIPDLSTKAKAQEYIGLNMEQLQKEKEEFKKEVVPQWDRKAKEAGLIVN